MNIGFYIDTINGSPTNLKIFEALNHAVKTNKVNDASLFFNNVGFNPVESSFGQFDATDIWHFRGTLVTNTFANVAFCKKIVNKFKLLYLFTAENKDIVSLLAMKEVPIITISKEDQDYVFRVTGKEPTLINGLNIESILQV